MAMPWIMKSMARCSAAPRSNPTSTRRQFTSLTFIVGAMYLLWPASAAAVQDTSGTDPRQFVENLGAEAIDIIKTQNNNMPERQRRFRALFAETFDAPAIGRFVLGQYWSQLSDEERKRYLDLFSNYIAAIYAIQFSHYEGETFKTLSVDTVGSGDSSVRAEIDRPGQQPIPLAFRVRRTSENPRIVDVTVEAVSLIVTKRDDFSAVLSKEGVDGVIKRMQAVLNQV